MTFWSRYDPVLQPRGNTDHWTKMKQRVCFQLFETCKTLLLTGLRSVQCCSKVPTIKTTLGVRIGPNSETQLQYKKLLGIEKLVLIAEFYDTRCAHNGI